MDKIVLKKCPIVENTINLLCDYQLPVDAVVGVIYQLLNNKSEDISLLQEPICNIPYEIRKSDPNLKDKATHRIITKNGHLLIGERSLSIVTKIPYTTWEESSKFVYEIINLLLKGKVIKKYNSINIRYLNFFDVNIFDNIKLNIAFNNTAINYPATILKTEIPSNNGVFISVLQIANSVHIKNTSLNLDADGSLIDLTVVCKSIEKDSFESIKTIIEELHQEEESLFFKLLTENFIDKLK